jgi:small-conductance mechanosensitive channel
MSLFPRVILLIALLPTMLPAVHAAEPVAVPDWVPKARTQLAEIERHLGETEPRQLAHRRFAGYKDTILSLRSKARDCVATESANVDSTTTRITALGTPGSGETADVAHLRSDLERQLQRASGRRAECEQVAQQGQDLFNQIIDLEKAALTAVLFTRTTPTWRVLNAVITDPVAWSRLVTGLLASGSGWDRLDNLYRGSTVALVLLLFGAGWLLRRFWQARSLQTDLARSVVSALPWALPAAGAFLWFAVLLPEWPPVLIASVALAVLAWLGAGVVVDALLGGWIRKGMNTHDARVLGRWVRILSALFLAGWLLLSADAVIGLPDTHYLFLRTVMVWLMALGLIWSGMILGRAPGLAGTQGVRILNFLAVVTIAMAETLGYRNLSEYLLLGLAGTAAGLIAFSAASRMFTRIYDGLDEGKHRWQRGMRHWLGLQPDEKVPGLIWARLVTGLVVWSGCLLWVLWSWGLSDQSMSLVFDNVTSGFEIGSLHFAPAQLLGAIAVLSIGMSLSRWIKLKLVPDLVQRTRLDRGGREAIITISGYAGVSLTLLIALGVAGISYSNLALIAGALSVGIGFGLQNVVNNFVSGLILLFERPVRTGDWVVVGDIQGYVRKISIRSTQIETFDRADVIVPNSELISNRVANLMLNDPWGRIKVPVGVAYGSNVQQVMELLLEIANNHPLVLKNQPGVGAPLVLFREFGDSALLFELRCFIRQIDRRLSTISDMNIAIDQAFRAAGISIPFPQRDVYLRRMSTPPQ